MAQPFRRPFESAWSLLKAQAMHGENPFKDVREQALMDVLDEQHTDGGWKGSGKQRPGMATLAGGAPPLTSDNSEPEDLLYQNMTQEEADEFNRQQAAQNPLPTQPFATPELLARQRNLSRQNELGLEPEGPTEPEDDYPFPKMKTPSGEMKDYRQPSRAPMNIP